MSWICSGVRGETAADAPDAGFGGGVFAIGCETGGMGIEGIVTGGVGCCGRCASDAPCTWATAGIGGVGVGGTGGVGTGTVGGGASLPFVNTQIPIM